MRRSERVGVACVGVLFVAGTALAQSVALSLGIRETGTAAAIGDDGGTSGGVEWVDLDVRSVPLDGAWHLVTFTLPGAALSPFAGASADGAYSTMRGTIEHLRIRNVDGLAGPITLYLDDLSATDAAGAPTMLGWEGLPLGGTHVFQEPGFSGTTQASLVDMGVARVTDAMAYSGSQSYEVSFQWVDDDPSRWVRLTTFSGGDLSGGNPAIDFNGAVSFRVKGIPGPGVAGLACVAGVAALRRRRR